MTPTVERRIDRDALLARVDLESLLDSLTTRASNRRAWNCIDPNHPDAHPSVTMTVDRNGIQRWRCWSGGHGGTAIDAIVVAKRVDVGEAIRWLNDHHAHLEPIQRPPAPAHRPVGEPAREVIEYVERAEKLLWTPAGAATRQWLSSRGLHEPVLRVNRVGADPGRRFLPRPKGFAAGWPAAVFPALTADGDVSYFQARILEPRAGRGKYDNPAVRWACNPRVGWAQPDPRITRPALVITEGLPDALLAAQAGFRSAGLLGAFAADRRVVDEIAEVARRSCVGGVVICVDADAAGRALEEWLTSELTEAGVSTHVVRPPDGTDLSQWSTESDLWISEVEHVAGPGMPSATQSPARAVGR